MINKWQPTIEMKILSYFLVLTFSGFPFFAFPQKSDSHTIAYKSSHLYLSYNSSLIYPGFRLGMELPVKTVYVTKTTKSDKEKKFTKDRFITTNVSWYHHPSFHDNLYLTSGWTMRRTKPKGFFTEFSPEIGLSRTFLGGTTYEVNDSGNIKIKKLAGYYYALISVGGGIGYDFEKTKHKPVMVFSKLNVLTMFPYNSTYYLRPAFEIGIIYKPSDFLNVKVHSKNK
jgi:hypothetical protein